MSCKSTVNNKQYVLFTKGSFFTLNLAIISVKSLLFTERIVMNVILAERTGAEEMQSFQGRYLL